MLAIGTREDEPLRWKKVLQSGALMLVPFAMILVEPDLGTAMVLPFIWLVMLFAAGATWRQLAVIVGTATAAFATV